MHEGMLESSSNQGSAFHQGFTTQIPVRIMRDFVTIQSVDYR